MNKESLRLNKLIKQGARYLIVGFSSFALEFLLFFVLFEVLGVFVVVSNVIAIAVASLYNFIMSREWTFKSTSSLMRSIVLYLILFAWNQFFSSWVIITLMNWGVSAELAKIGTMAVIVCWNFVLYRKVVFK
ncbi:MAG: GtrA family protein [Coriobacteriales bacterium]|nr:GtrA family protein [Coriobacteriales bacterium]